ncbi:MAG: hypothetical protein PUK40_00095, partial [Actinomycetaceae bacterium]|nr:hypothetical protein [Actinomycetaceae bacterium]
MWKKTSTEALAINNTSEVIVVVLAAIITPQVILRALPTFYTFTQVLWALLAGIIAFALVVAMNSRVTAIAPRRSSHQLASRYAGTWVGIVVGAARILALAVLVMLGIELVVSSLSAIIPLEGMDHYLAAALTFIVPIPIFIRTYAGRMPIIRTLAILGALTLAVLLGYALVAEAVGAINFEQIIAARHEAYRAEASQDTLASGFAGVLGALLPAAVYVVTSERVMVAPQLRRTPVSHAYTVGVPLMVVIAVTMYFVGKLELPGLRLGIPALSIAVAMWGDIGRTVIATIFAASGLAAAYASYRQLPRLLRELSIDGLLPRRLAAQDAQSSRRWAVLLIASLSAIVLLFLDSTRALAMVFVSVAFLIALATA